MTSRVSVRILSNRGLSLAGLLVALAVGAVLSLMIASLLSQIFQNSSRTMMLGDANGTARFVQLIVANKTLCDNALRDSSDNKLTYYPTGGIDNIPVSQIRVINPTTGLDTLGIQVGPSGTMINPKLKLNSITLQEQASGFGRSTVQINTAPVGSPLNLVQYDLFHSQLVLSFSGVGLSGTTGVSGVAGGTSLPAVIIPITVAVNPSNHLIDYCYRNDTTAFTCQSVGGSSDAQGNCQSTIYSDVAGFTCDSSTANNPPCTGSLGSGCVWMFFINGFTSAGKPDCGCQQQCP